LKRDIKYVEIEFEGVNNVENFSEFGKVRTESGVSFLRIKSEETTNKAIKEILKKNGKIVSVVPVKSTLEEHFMRAINE